MKRVVNIEVGNHLDDGRHGKGAIFLRSVPDRQPITVLSRRAALELASAILDAVREAIPEGDNATRT